MSGAIVENERRTNRFLEVITSRKRYADLLGKCFSDPLAILLVPRAVAISKVDVIDEFLEAHIALRNPKKPQEFVTANGLRGLYKGVNGEAVSIFSELPESRITLTAFAPFAFRGATRLKSEHRILAEFSYEAHGVRMPCALINVPISFSGAAWEFEQFDGSPAALTPAVSALQLNATPTTAVTGSQSPRPIERDSSGYATSSAALGLPSGAASTVVAEKGSSFQYYLNLFVDRIHKISMYPIYSSIVTFMTEIMDPATLASMTMDQVAVRVREFLNRTLQVIAQHPLWFGISEEDFDVLQETLEFFVMTKLHPVVFCAGTTNDAAEDARTTGHIESLSQVTPAQLEVNPTIFASSRFGAAQRELRKLDRFKTPRDKLMCILSCTKILMSMIEEVGVDANADIFLPALIYTVIKVNPPQLHSHMQYIRRFRHPDKLCTGEQAFAFMNLECAISYLIQLNPATLATDPLQEKRKRLSSIAQLASSKDRLLQGRPMSSHIEFHQTSATPIGGPLIELESDLTNNTLNIMSNSIPENDDGGDSSTSEEEEGEESAKVKFLTCSPDDLNRDEIFLLLCEYRRLIQENVQE